MTDPARRESWLGIGRLQWADAWAGFRAVLPLAPGAVIFGMAFGALVREMGLDAWIAPFASSTVVAGASQFAILEAVRVDAPGVVAVLTALVINTRLALYSAALAPVFAAFPRRWQMGIAYLTTDQSAAVTLQHADRWPDPVRRRWFAVGIALPFVLVWIAGTIAGVVLGPVIPDSWQIGFIVPLMFIAVMVPGLRSWPALTAAAVAVAVVVGFREAPYGLNVLFGALAGIGVGSLIPPAAPKVDDAVVAGEGAAP